MKKIVFVTGSMGRGGAERVISLLGDYYVSQGWKVYILMQLHPYIEYKLNPEIKIIDVSSKKGIKKGFISTIVKVGKKINELNPDVIVSFMAQNCLILGLSKFSKEIPVIMSERIDPSQVKRNYIYRILLNKIYKNASSVIFQTNRAKLYFPQDVQDNGCIISNPISVTTTCDDSGKTKNRIVTAGRLTHQKNHKMLIKAFSLVAQFHPEYCLDIYGDGPLRDELLNYVEELKLSEKVRLLGNVPDLHEQISDAQIFVLSSNFEGLSNALLEAMMMGFPVISTKCAGSDEIIVNNENGILIPVNDVEELSKQLNRLINDKDLREKLSKNAKISVEYCKVENIIDQWDKVILKAVK